MHIKARVAEYFKAHYDKFVLKKAKELAHLELFGLGYDRARVTAEDYDCIVSDYVERIHNKHNLMIVFIFGFILGAWLF